MKGHQERRNKINIGLDIFQKGWGRRVFRTKHSMIECTLAAVGVYSILFVHRRRQFSTASIWLALVLFHWRREVACENTSCVIKLCEDVAISLTSEVDSVLCYWEPGVDAEGWPQCGGPSKHFKGCICFHPNDWEMKKLKQKYLDINIWHLFSYQPLYTYYLNFIFIKCSWSTYYRQQGSERWGNWSKAKSQVSPRSVHLATPEPLGDLATVSSCLVL